jgi:chromate reductase
VSERQFHILGIVGSLRQASYNRALLRAAQELAPEGVSIETHDLDAIPLFNADVEAQGYPEPVQDLKERIRSADALLIVTPEYNWGIPGVLKNAIDWVSRPITETPLRHKPTAIMGTSTGPYGTARAQLQLRQTLAYTRCYILPEPDVILPLAEGKFDAEGHLHDESTREKVRAVVEGLVKWAERLYPEGSKQ